jgi:hypothetical protein
MRDGELAIGLDWTCERTQLQNSDMLEKGQLENLQRCKTCIECLGLVLKANIPTMSDPPIYVTSA